MFLDPLLSIFKKQIILFFNQEIVDLCDLCDANASGVCIAIHSRAFADLVSFLS